MGAASGTWSARATLIAKVMFGVAHHVREHAPHFERRLERTSVIPVREHTPAARVHHAVEVLGETNLEPLDSA